MKLHVLSDLHVEFAPFEIPPTDADVVVLAGDIGVGLAGVKLGQAIGKPVVYVAGNHEYYGKAIPHDTEKMRALAAGTNVRVLEDEQTVIGGVRFLGCTLWMDFELFGEERADAAMWEAQTRMTDFRRIRRSPQFRRFTPRDARLAHHRSLTWLQARLAEPFDGPTVVVTHHTPSPRSLPERYRDDLLSAAYASNLDAFLTDHPVALWIHGHIHERQDYHVGATRVVCNPRGYPDEPAPGFESGLVVEVSRP